MAWLILYFDSFGIKYFVKNHFRILMEYSFLERCHDYSAPLPEIVAEDEKVTKMYDGAERKIGFNYCEIIVYRLTPESREIIKDVYKFTLDTEKDVFQGLPFSSEEVRENTEDEKVFLGRYAFKPSVLDEYLDYLKPLRYGGKVCFNGIIIEEGLSDLHLSIYSFYDKIFNETDGIAKNIQYEDKREKFLKFAELGRNLIFYECECSEDSQWREILQRINKYNGKILEELDRLFLPEKVTRILKKNRFLEVWKDGMDEFLFL